MITKLLKKILQELCNHKYERYRIKLPDGREYPYNICSNCGKKFYDYGKKKKQKNG